MFENYGINLREVAKEDLNQMIMDCERELERRVDEARNNAMKRILDAINDYVNKFGSLEICRQEEDDDVGIIIHNCDTLIGHPDLISVVLV